MSEILPAATSSPRVRQHVCPPGAGGVRIIMDSLETTETLRPQHTSGQYSRTFVTVVSVG